MIILDKVKVSKEVAEALNQLDKDDWTKEFNLISHCKSFSGNGIRMQSTFVKELEALNALKPLDFAKCLIVGYEIKEDSNLTD